MSKAAYPYGYATPPLQLTVAELEQRASWYRMHPELRRRLLALMDACPHDLGVGGGWRSSALQEATFRARYTAHDEPPGILWEGQWWRKKPDVAPSAPPGLSFHESTTPDGYALAVDMLNVQPAIGWANQNCHGFGLKHFGNVNGEPWHFQPLETPNARRNYDPDVHRIVKWAFEGDAVTMYVVVAGDAWASIAAANGITLAALLAENEATPSTPLHPGNWVRIPPPPPPPPPEEDELTPEQMDELVERTAKRAAELVWQTRLNVVRNGTVVSANAASVLGWTHNEVEA